MQQRVEIPGVGVVEFPAEMTPEQVDAAAAKLYKEYNPPKLPGGMMRLLPMGGAAGSAMAGASMIREARRVSQTPVGRGGMGFLKGVARTALDSAKMASLGSGNILALRMVPDELDAALQPKDDAERYGGYASDVATVMLPGGAVAKGAKLLRPMAGGMLRRAVPALKGKGAEQVLSRGLGRVSMNNAAALAKEASATLAGRARLQPAAEAMSKAAKTKGPKLSATEAMAMTLGLGGGIGLNSPFLGAALGASSLLGRPRVASGIAQGLHSAAPALQFAGGGLTAEAAAAALRALLSGRE
jgi:hypothetical protein